MFDEAIKQSLFATDCKTFIYAIIQNIADATSEQIVRHPEEKDKLLQLGFTYDVARYYGLNVNSPLVP